MTRFMLVTFAALVLMQSRTWADPPATQPDAVITSESEAVRVNGADFQIVAPYSWTEPAGNAVTQIALGLKVTNHSGKELNVDIQDGLRAIVKDSSGKELRMAEGVDGLPRRDLRQRDAVLAPVTLKDGESTLIAHNARLRRTGEQGQEFSLTGSNGTAFWSFEHLAPGQYTISLEYESVADPNDPTLWTGKAVTNPLPIEIAVPAAKRTLHYSGVLDDGSAVTVTALAPDVTVVFANKWTITDGKAAFDGANISYAGEGTAGDKTLSVSIDIKGDAGTLEVNVGVGLGLKRSNVALKKSS